MIRWALRRAIDKFGTPVVFDQVRVPAPEDAEVRTT
jgi:hypothetical protein